MDGSLHNVDGMLDRMTPAQMDAVVAYDNVHGVGLDRLIEIVARGLAALMLQWSGDKNADLEDIRQDIDPWYQR